MSTDIAACSDGTFSCKHNRESLTHRARVQIERQVPQLGTLDPVVFLPADLFAWFEGMSDENRQVFRRWLRRFAYDYGHLLEPRIEMTPS